MGVSWSVWYWDVLGSVGCEVLPCPIRLLPLEFEDQMSTSFVREKHYHVEGLTGLQTFLVGAEIGCM